MSRKNYCSLSPDEVPAIIDTKHKVEERFDGTKIHHSIIKFAGVKSKYIRSAYLTGNDKADETLIDYLMKTLEADAKADFVEALPNRHNWPARPYGLKSG